MQFLKLGATALAAGFLAVANVPGQAHAQPAAVQLTKQMVAPMNEARTAIIAQDWAMAKAKLDAAAGLAKTPQDKLALEQLRLSLAAQSNDAPGQIKSIEALLATGLLTPDDAKRYKAALPKAYLDSGDAAKSMAAGRAYIDEYGGTHDQYIALANDAVKINDNATGVSYAEKAITAAKAAGGKPPESYYRLLAKAHQQAKEMDKYYATVERALTDYPKEAYWKELIARAQLAPNFGSATRLDLFRTLIAAGVKLSPTEKSTAAAEAVKRGLPNEALQILQPAFASGELGSNVADKETMTKATDGAADDKKNLAKEEAETLAKGDGSALAKLGEAFLSYGDNAKAADLIQKGLTKGILDAAAADVAKLHLGIAQYRAGQKDAARATWAGVKADNGAAIFAQNWVLISNLIP